jgi:hypothetical protein
MSGSIEVLVHTLRSVRHGASDIRYRQDALLAELTSPRATSVAIATVQLYDAVDGFETVVGHLRAIAAELDCDLGRRAIASLGELVLHLRVFTILSQVEQLAQAIHSADVEICALFTGRFRSIGDVVAMVYDQISRMWLEYGHLIREPGGRVRRDVVREAHRALTLIGNDPDLMYLLRIGMAHPDWPGVFCACANLAELLALTVDIEPDAALFQADPDPELIDDLPASVRAGIRRDERKR